MSVLIFVFIVSVAAAVDFVTDVRACSALVTNNDTAELQALYPSLKLIAANTTWLDVEWRPTADAVTICFDSTSARSFNANVWQLMRNVTAKALTLAGFKNYALFADGLDARISDDSTTLRSVTLQGLRIEDEVQELQNDVTSSPLTYIALKNVIVKPKTPHIFDLFPGANSVVEITDSTFRNFVLIIRPYTINLTAGTFEFRARNSVFDSGRLQVFLDDLLDEPTGSLITASTIDIVGLKTVYSSIRLAAQNISIAQSSFNRVPIQRIAAFKVLRIVDSIMSLTETADEEGFTQDRTFYADFTPVLSALRSRDRWTGLSYMLVFGTVNTRNVTVDLSTASCPEQRVPAALFLNGNTESAPVVYDLVDLRFKSNCASFLCPFARQISADKGITCKECPAGQFATPNDTACEPCPTPDCKTVTSCPRGYAFVGDRCEACPDGVVFNGTSCDCPMGTTEAPDNEYARFHGVKVCTGAAAVNGLEIIALLIGLLATIAF